MSDEIIPTARPRSVTQLKYPLPHPGLSFERHLELVKAYSVLSKEGKDAVNYKDVGKTISPFKVSGNSKFFENIGILSRAEGQGRYKPTEDALDIYRDLVWKKETGAKSKIRTLVLRSWFWETTKNLLSIKSSISEDDLIQQLGREAGADPRIHTPSLRVLISYIRFADLLVEEDGMLTLSGVSGLVMPQEGEKPSGVDGIRSSAPIAEIDQNTIRSGQVPIVIGVLVQADTPEDQIRRAVRIILDATGRAENSRATT